MSNTVFQIRRSNTSANPGTTLNSGELAYSFNTNNLFIGAQTGVGTAGFMIGGAKYVYVSQAGAPGVQTANAVPILDANSYVGNVFTQGLGIQVSVSGTPTVFVNTISNSGGSYLGANSSGGGMGTELATTAAISSYVTTKLSGSVTGGTNTQVQFNNSGSFGASSGFTFNYATNTAVVSNALSIGVSASVGNSTVNVTVNSTAFSGTANNASNLGGAAAASYVVNSMSGSLTGNVTLAGTNTVISSNLTVTSGLITASSANVSVQNMNVSGNLTVSGTVTTINTSDLQVNSNFIQLADSNKTTDTIDEGFFGTAGNSSVTYYPGIFRVASLGTLQNPYFYVFATKNNPNTASTLDLSAANTFTGTLAAYLAPYGSGGAFIVNSSVVNITANSTVSSALVANSITLTTALAAAYGGTGQLGGYTAGDTLYASGASAISRLAVGTNGYVMQVTSNLPAWGTLDGGTF
jgi:hypothetical protein